MPEQPLKSGDLAPEFTLQAANRKETFSLRQLWGLTTGRSRRNSRNCPT
jgi:hypothetical protein